VLATVQRHLDGAGAGIGMVTVRLLYVHPPEEVHGAFSDVASAQEDKLRTINRARTFVVEKVQPGRGEAAAMVQEALAFRDEQILKARDEAAGFGLQADAYRAAPDLTTFRLQLEAIEEVLPGTARSLGRASATSSSSIYGSWSRSAGKRGDGGAQAASRGRANLCPDRIGRTLVFGAVTSRSSRASPQPGPPPWCGGGTPIRSASCAHGTRCLRCWGAHHPPRRPRPAPAWSPSGWASVEWSLGLSKLLRVAGAVEPTRSSAMPAAQQLWHVSKAHLLELFE
jgi:hypothetical protein